MPVVIHGKEYMTVAERINDMHTQTSGVYSLCTEVVEFTADTCVMRAVLDIPERGQYVGHAYELKSSSQINKTSHLENCETSAIGRALAAAGYGGTEYASANEVQNAIQQQEEKAEAPEKTTKERFLEKWFELAKGKDAAGILKGFDLGHPAEVEDHDTDTMTLLINALKDA